MPTGKYTFLTEFTDIYLCFVRLSPVRYTLDIHCAGEQIVNRNNRTPYATLFFPPIFVNSPDLLYRQAIRFFGITVLLMLKNKSHLSFY